MIRANETQSPASRPWVLLTGATGVLGSYLLQELLARGHRVLCLVRAPSPSAARQRLSVTARCACGDIESRLEQGQLAILRGDLHRPRLGLDDRTVAGLVGRIRSVIHAAGSVVFTAQRDGEPLRTNVDGTREVLTLAANWECRDWHVVSTAYVCGQTEHAVEQFADEPPDFRNDYEQSKWTAEVESRRAARDVGAALTVYRPGVIVGHSETGATARFTGIYYLFRAVALLARAADQRGDDRGQIPLRIQADAKARPNLAFVDDVARELVDVFESPSTGGGVYHLTHPKPPSNRMIKRALEGYYHIGGGQFVGRAGTPERGEPTTYEAAFTGALGAMSDYLLDAPRFDRGGTDGLVHQPPAPWTMARLHQLLAFAEACDWRPAVRREDTAVTGGSYADYFERFMPQRIAQSKIAQLENLNLSVRYAINAADGDWICRFHGGHLQSVERAGGQVADVTYHMDASSFWRVVSGASTSALFLSGDARIEGDVERALKFAGIVQDFVNVFPYDVSAQ
jgi:thioester reductase-like protein